jgi:hypothetical protein
MWRRRRALVGEIKNLPGVPDWVAAQAKRLMSDPVRKPAHYTRGEIEVIDFIEQVVKDYPPEIAHHIGCLIKYVARAPHKGNMQQDLSKGEWYLARAINKVAELDRTGKLTPAACPCREETALT